MKVVSPPSLSSPVWLLPWVVSFSVTTLVSQVINGRPSGYLCCGDMDYWCIISDNVAGGVTSMDSFLKKFFPSVYHKEKEDHHESMYCKFDSHLLQLFTSSLYLSALVASFFSSTVTRLFGRKISMLSGGLVFLVGAILNGAATNVAMLIIGRLLLGVGIGFVNQVTSCFSRCRLCQFEMAITFGKLIFVFPLFCTVCSDLSIWDGTGKN